MCFVSPMRWGRAGCDLSHVGGGALQRPLDLETTRSIAETVRDTVQLGGGGSDPSHSHLDFFGCCGSRGGGARIDGGDLGERQEAPAGHPVGRVAENAMGLGRDLPGQTRHRLDVGHACDRGSLQLLQRRFQRSGELEAGLLLGQQLRRRARRQHDGLAVDAHARGWWTPLPAGGRWRLPHVRRDHRQPRILLGRERVWAGWRREDQRNTTPAQGGGRRALVPRYERRRSLQLRPEHGRPPLLLGQQSERHFR